MKIYTYDPFKKRSVVAGEIVGYDFIKTVRRDRHYLHVVHGYAIQDDVIEQIKSKIYTIVIHETDTGVVWNIPIGDFLQHSKTWTKGHGPQLVISEKYLAKGSEFKEEGRI